MRKQFIISVFVMMFVCLQVVTGQAKYVFYFIGDGMGVNHVNMTEVYLSALKGERGSASLLMTQFPAVTMAATFSADNDVTESSAAGTALATGVRTKNSHVGIDANANRVETLAEKAKKAGKKVGVASTVTVNHATPASFYAHQRDRNMYYEIAQDMIKSGMDFFAGAGVMNRNRFFDNSTAPDIYPLIEQAGFYIAKGYADYKANAAKAGKIFLVHENWEKTDGIPYAIDRTDKDLSLKEITEAAIESLMKDNNKGFFVMLEAGRIDWAAHANDGAAVIKEVIDMNEALQVAYDFYKKRPKETLIVVAADHETGGLTVGKGSLNIRVISNQKVSLDKLTEQIGALSASKNGNVTWEEIKNLLTETMGFWKAVPINWEREKLLRDAYEEVFAVRRGDTRDRNFSLIATRAKVIINDIAGLGWATGAHSAGYIPVYAIGAGQELFKGQMHIMDIPGLIAKAAKYK